MNESIRVMPEGFGGVLVKDITNIHPLGLSAVLALGILMVLLPRRWAVLPMLVIACFIPSAQKIVILSLDFNLLRIMVLFGVVRMLIHREYQNFNWKTIDKVIILYAVSAVIVFTLQQATFGAFVSSLGQSFDTIGLYFLFRCLIRNWYDINRLIVGCIIISIPVMIAFAVEKSTQRNFFSIFGGVPEFTMIRDGKLRCQGAFSHPIIAGCFWAALIPLFAFLWWKNNKGKCFAVIGIISSLFIIFSCNSSTPLFGFISATLGGLMFPLRHRMREIRWGIVLILTALHFIMKAPVWFLIARMSSIFGGTGFHRSALIDAFIRRISEWFLLGTTSTAHWSWGGQDITNQYIFVAVRGGALTLVLFLIIIVLAFQGVGRLWRVSVNNSIRLILSWALGVSLFVHCMNFIGVTYFGQIHIVWFLTLGIIGSMCPVKENSRKKTSHAKQLMTNHSKVVNHNYIIKPSPK